MAIANKLSYLAGVCDELALQWPQNHTVNLVCHGHSVPAGYFATPYVNTFGAYPHLLHRLLKERFPYAVLNVIVTAVGGENAIEGANRFREEALCHRPAVLTIDYGLNDRSLPLEEAERAWRQMLEQALDGGAKLLLLTPSWDQSYYAQNGDWKNLELHAEQIRRLAEEYGVGLADAFAAFQRHIDAGGELQELLSHVNHPSRKGHELIASSIAQWFLAR